jgi:hypothetical protein
LYSEFFQIPFGSEIKVQTCPDDLVCPELIFSSTPNLQWPWLLLCLSDLSIWIMNGKLKRLTTCLVLEVFWDCTWSRLKILYYSNLLRAEFQKSGRLQNCITPKPFTISRCANNCGKDQKVLYNSCIWLQVRFLSEQSHLCTYWLLLTVESDSASVPKFSFWSFLCGFEDAHLSWYLHGMMWCLSHVHDCSFRKIGLI